MKRKMSCLGVVSHVGVVLSFVIFVTFLIFIFIIVQPMVGTKNNQNMLNNLKDVLIERVSTELTSVSVLVDEESLCVRLSGFFNEIGSGKGVIVRNKEGKVLSKILEQNLDVTKNTGETFLKIYSSEEFSIEPGTIPGCQESDYTFGLIKSEKNIFETRIIQIIESYNNDYESLKGELNIAQGNEFRLDFVYANGTIISTEEKEVLVSVFVDEFPIQYISKDAVRELGSLNVGIW